MGRLDNKVAFLTAAGAGIAHATALAFAREGARVIASDRDPALVAKLGEELQALGTGKAHQTLVLDVTDHAAIRALAEANPDVDVLFNCAGWVYAGDILHTGLDAWQRSFDINVTPIFVAMQAFLPGMVARGGGSIVNIASVASSLKGVVNRAAYMASKAAVIGLSKSVAMDFMSRGIRVNTICPGTIDSPSLHERARATGDETTGMASFVARQPIGRLGQPEEIAAIAIYLAGDESSYTTGTDVIVDGGIRL